MRKFKNNTSDGWLMSQELRFFRNFINNWTKDVEDDDFFAIFGNPNNTSRDDAKKYFTKFFSTKELEKTGAIRIDAAEPETPEDDDEYKELFGFDFTHGDITRAIQTIWNATSMRNRCREMLLAWTNSLGRRKTAKRAHRDPMEKRMAEVAAALKLDEIDREVLLFALVRALTCFDDFPTRMTRGRHDKELFYAMALDCPVSDVARALSGDGKLIKFEILDNDADLCHSPFRTYLEQGGKTSLDGEFYRKCDLSAALPWDYFGAVARAHGAILKRLIVSAGNGDGANILLYGAPGTGKTSFTRALAKELGLELYEIRQGNREGSRNGPSSRIAGIRICNDQIAPNSAIVMVDEADQLLRTNLDYCTGSGLNAASTEKGLMNSLIDDIKLPVVWISNAPAMAMDESVRRRFDYSICFEKLDEEQRKAIWRNNVNKLHMERLVGEDLISAFARKYETSAGGISMVLDNVRRMKAKKGEISDLVDKLMAPHCKLMETDTATSANRLSSDYSLDGLNINGEISLDRIVGAVKKFRAEIASGVQLDPDRPRMNLLLYGPPGTGKTEFVKFLGQETGAKVLVKMGSDLLNCYVGVTEAKIRHAFEEAEETNSILFMDEIDGMVQSRNGASHSWEVTQVNEILKCMEDFKGVMVAATNFMDNLDQAILRRFTFKLAFDWLDDAGKCAFFERMFKSSPTTAEIARLSAIPNLAPGDFRTVRQSLYYLDGEITNSMRLAGLEKESAVKKASAHSRIAGFAI